MMPSATWPRDLRRAAAAASLWQRLEGEQAAGTRPGRVSLASLRADLDAGAPPPSGVDPLGWVFSDTEPASLRMRPGARAVYRLRDTAGTRFESRLVAEAAPGSGSGLRFLVEIAGADGRALGRVERRLAGPGEGTIARDQRRAPGILDPRTWSSASPSKPPGTASVGSGRWLDPCLTALRRHQPASPRAPADRGAGAGTHRLGPRPGQRCDRLGARGFPSSSRSTTRSPSSSTGLALGAPPDRSAIGSCACSTTRPPIRRCASCSPRTPSRTRGCESSAPRAALGISGATNSGAGDGATASSSLLLDHDDEIAHGCRGGVRERAEPVSRRRDRSTPTRRRSTRPTAGREISSSPPGRRRSSSRTCTAAISRRFGARSSSELGGLRSRVRRVPGLRPDPAAERDDRPDRPRPRRALLLALSREVRLGRGEAVRLSTPPSGRSRSISSGSDGRPR